MTLGRLWSDTRRAARRMRRSPLFFATVILTISVCVGATSAVYRLVDSAVLAPLPYESPERLLLLTETSGEARISSSYLNVLDWGEQSSALSDVAFYVRRNFTRTGGGPAERVAGLGVSTNLFSTLGVEPVLGRGISAAAGEPGGPAEAVLGDGFWQTRFGGNPNVLGQTIQLDGQSYEVVGVMPPGFYFPGGIILGSSQLYVGVGDLVEQWVADGRGSHPGIYAIGRMNEDVEFETARDELTQVSASIRDAYPEIREDTGIFVMPVLDVLLGDLPRTLALLAGAGVLVLLIGFGNASGLFLARSIGEQRDLSVARALGADRSSLLIHVVAVGLLVGLVAGGLALLVAEGVIRAFGDALGTLPRLAEVSLSPTAILLTLGLAVAGSIVVAVAPVFGFIRRGHQTVTGSAQVGAGRSATRARAMMVAGQLALVVVLVSASLVLLRSFAQIQAADGGIEPSGVLIVRVSLPAEVYEAEGRTDLFYEQLRDQIASAPGVQEVGGISTLPFSGAGAQARFITVGMTPDEAVRSDVNVVFPGYFESMGVTLLDGRFFDETDRADSQPVVIVDEVFAERFWPGEDPIGKPIRGWGIQLATVVGVVEHVKNYGVTSESREELYMPHSQRPYLAMFLSVRTDTDPTALAEPIQEFVTALDPNVPISSVRAMRDVVEATTSRPRIAAMLGSTLALLASILAFLGAYALVSHSVAQRRAEFGLRMALGASDSKLIRMVLRSGIRIAAIGAIVGLIGAALSSRVLEGMLFGVPAADPVSFVGSALAVVLLVLGATYLPARRAASVDPIDALRSE